MSRGLCSRVNLRTYYNLNFDDVKCFQVIFKLILKDRKANNAWLQLGPTRLQSKNLLKKENQITVVTRMASLRMPGQEVKRACLASAMKQKMFLYADFRI